MCACLILVCLTHRHTYIRNTYTLTHVCIEQTTRLQYELFGKLNVRLCFTRCQWLARNRPTVRLTVRTTNIYILPVRIDAMLYMLSGIRFFSMCAVLSLSRVSKRAVHMVRCAPLTQSHAQKCMWVTVTVTETRRPHRYQHVRIDNSIACMQANKYIRLCQTKALRASFVKHRIERFTSSSNEQYLPTIYIYI